MLLLLAACSSAPVPAAPATSAATPPTAPGDTGLSSDTATEPTADTGDSHPLSGWDTGVPADCSFTEVESGPFASDAAAWSVTIVRPEGDNRFGVVAATYTADGRPLSETDLQTEGGVTTEWTYVPGDWRIATVDTSGIFPPTHQDWSWNSSLATIESTGPGDSPTIYRTFRIDGLPLSQTIDSQIVGSWQYLGPVTWQLASDPGFTWSWDCLTGTAVSTGAVRRRFHPDGRVRFEARDHEQDGVDDRTRTVRYIGDSWRVDYEIIDMDADGPEAPFVVDWVWTPL